MKNATAAQIMLYSPNGFTISQAYLQNSCGTVYQIAKRLLTQVGSYDDSKFTRIWRTPEYEIKHKIMKIAKPANFS